MGWDDIIHIVMVPSYKTPHEVLVGTLESLAQFSYARTQMGVCLAMEEREEGSFQKAKSLQAEYKDRFRFVWSTFHPSGLPDHVPGKSSNECWAFSKVLEKLSTEHRIER